MGFKSIVYGARSVFRSWCSRGEGCWSRVFITRVWWCFVPVVSSAEKPPPAAAPRALLELVGSHLRLG